MSHRTWKNRIEDILACLDNIRLFTDGLTFETFIDDPKTVRAVAFELTTIGEAARNIPDEIHNRFPKIPWEKMRGIRNILIHEYFRLDEEIIWKTVQDDLPDLYKALENISKEAD